MSTAAHAVDVSHPPEVNLTKFGMLTFLASEAMLFAGLITAYLILWISQGHAYRPEFVKENGFEFPTWPLLLTGFNTLLLFSSSATLYWAEKAVVKGTAYVLPLFLTTVLGAVFVSIQAHEWLELKAHSLWFNTGGTYTSSFFTLTGFHGLHVFIGVVFLAITTLMAAAGRFTPHRHNFLTCVSLYWHFVDIVWVFLFTVMYILPYFIR